MLHGLCTVRGAQAGDWPLHAAACSGSSAVVRALLEGGALASAANKVRRGSALANPMSSGERSGYVTVRCIQLERSLHGAHACMVKACGTPWHAACRVMLRWCVCWLSGCRRARRRSSWRVSADTLRWQRCCSCLRAAYAALSSIQRCLMLVLVVLVVVGNG